MTTFLGQLSYFSGKTVTDLISGVFATALVENVFGVIQKSMTRDKFFGILGVSDGYNEQLSRLVRIVVEPIFLLTFLNMIQTMMLGDAEMTGGPFLTLVVIAFAEEYTRQLKLFYQEMSRNILENIDAE